MFRVSKCVEYTNQKHYSDFGSTSTICRSVRCIVVYHSCDSMSVSMQHRSQVDQDEREFRCFMTNPDHLLAILQHNSLIAEKPRRMLFHKTKSMCFLKYLTQVCCIGRITWKWRSMNTSTTEPCRVVNTHDIYTWQTMISLFWENYVKFFQVATYLSCCHHVSGSLFLQHSLEMKKFIINTQRI